MKIIVIGDIILDTNHICNTTRYAPEANIPVYDVIQTNYILGGAGNVAKNLKNLECDVEIVSVIGNDYAGSQIKTLLNDNNIKHNLFTDNISRKTTQKTRVFCNSELVNRYDIEDTENISDEIGEQIIQYIQSIGDIDAILFSDYNKGVLTQCVCETLITYSKSNHIFTFVDPKPAGVLKYRGCFCFKLNLLEGETISDKTSKNDILHYLKSYIDCDHVILTCGENGLYVDSIEQHIYNDFPVDVVDVTGCGDTVLVVTSYMYLKTRNIVKSSKIANYVARKCVGVIGNHLVSISDLDEFIDNVIIDSETDKLEKLASIDNKKIVFTNGCFDIIHSAHIRLLQFSKKLGDILIVGINSDASVKRLKGESRPINDVVERCNLLNSLGIVDHIIVFDDDTPRNILSLLKPHIIVKGGDYTKETIIGSEYAKEIVIYDYINGISSTNTISKITNILLKSYSLHDNKKIPLDLKLDQIIQKHNGFFIELGANDGLDQSNTAFFEFYRGWKGLLIEPSFNKYQLCCVNRPNSIVQNYACVSNEYNENTIAGDFNGGLLSSVNGTRVNGHNLVTVNATTLEKLLDKYTTPGQVIDLLSLDTEGYELPILKGLNLEKYKPLHMLIEIYPKDYDEIVSFLSSYNYVLHSNFSNYNEITNPGWDGTHNDYLFIYKPI
jgi:D-beta-D-heptose 7-phosphate kinase/D-beta-D-heptose 1-phosphate adenosyltransferase